MENGAVKAEVHHEYVRVHTCAYVLYACVASGVCFQGMCLGIK